MARQEFLSGGFIGKLGQLVGQHWKNKRYVRSYVIPVNPQTPAQQANRAGFAVATRLAQQAMNINGGADFWLYGNRTEFQNRVGTARRRLLAGLSETDALPLYPDGYSEDTPITGYSTFFNESTRDVLFNSTAPIMSVDRVFNITMHVNSRDGSGWYNLTRSTTIQAGQPFRFVYEWFWEAQFSEGAWIEAATSDDASHNDEGIYLARSPVTQPHPAWVSDDWEIEPTNWDKASHQVTFECLQTLWPFTYDFYVKIRTFSYNSGTWTDRQYPAHSVNGTLTPLVLPWTNDYAYPEGAQFISTDGTIDDPLYVDWYVENTDFEEPTLP
jgi:hypothetical protein